ncbi:cytochrome P450 [Cladochytrium replicatum]|nr:cytochrome P450 [Cladochytrium replicatum]
MEPHPIFGHLANLLPYGYIDQSTIDKAFMEKSRILAQMISEGRFEKNPGAFRVEAFNPVMNIALGTVVVDPTDVNVVTDLLSGRAQDSQVKGKEYQTAYPLIGDGILSSSGPNWKVHRRLMEPGFRLEGLRAANKAMETPIDRVINRWMNDTANYADKPFDIRGEFLRLTVDVIAQVGFGRDFEGIDDKLLIANLAPSPKRRVLYQLFADVTHKMSQNVFLPPWFYKVPLPNNKAMMADIETLNKVVRTMIRDRMEAVKSGKLDTAKSGVLLDAFVAYENGEFVFTEDVLNDQIKTLLFAGHDTTGNTLSWSFYHIAKNRKVRDALLAEIDATFPGWASKAAENGFPPFPDYDTLIRMPYLNGFLNEILRLHPPAAFTRKITQDIVLGGHMFYKGTDVMVYPPIFHRNPEYFEKPIELIPERWVEEDQTLPPGIERVKLAMNRQAYFPFSLGQRNCVGMKFAQAELRVTIVRMLQMFEFESCDADQPKVILTMTINPGQVMMKVRRRKQ